MISLGSLLTMRAMQSRGAEPGKIVHPQFDAIRAFKTEEVTRLEKLEERRKDTISRKQAWDTGKKLGINWSTSQFDVEQFRMGMEVELEHIDITDGDLVMTGKIALAHLKELPDYYTKLKKYVEKGK